MPVSTSGPEGPNDRVQREVEQILEKTGERPSSLRMARSPGRAKPSWLRFSPGLLMLGALLFVLLSLVMSDQALPFVLGALFLFTAGYIWSMQKRNFSRRSRSVRTGGKPDVYWRGERVSQRKPIARSPAAPGSLKEAPAAKGKKKLGRR
ncbi:MAG: hypothetical protein EXR44_03395 [Dehalococcoidia bacterium]|nr:hypothetical protein [Dehalococcoidia bacterium]